MSEDNAKNLDADSTNPLPFEEFVRQHLALLIKQGNELREQQVKLQEEMVERFLQLSRQIKDLDQKVNVLTGKCRSIPEILPDGRLRLREVWQWTSGDFSRGASVIEELRD
jgi:hypothetical protein